uniref:Iq calmodulin-binding motif family protein n=2 Tax=Tetraselmis sp. GSL018 TaxID=582737 RepID=A0A061RVR3_9CHLO|mmetsp:Transcript_19746/g.47127  ORF Transcript_19746/g.47127 Transcript_19746/m.47127 type:complete len:364 (-) Transcript_19746:1270-2361(-)|eukprot:CAMPEP_0177608980 /NCGR_PEP_ID=MMETSP0419_2-20121207/18797_1 /TAXON_ID=582737 /ORGANISM="Tetraselmis sp., Strain GSL018" /LENGTH=363 /DNA_ID=CAMNT_0019103779 /DNA_START=283 /DNA_END=1374 /DNA_ORIENTATION=-
MARGVATLEPRQAATLIQALFRSYRVRKQLQKKQHAARKIQAILRGMLQRKQTSEVQLERRRRQRFQAVMARHQERVKASETAIHALRRVPAAHYSAYSEKREAAAVKIQARWRGHQARRAYCRRQPELDRRHGAAARIQQAFRRSHSSPLRGSVRESQGDLGGAGASVRGSQADAPLRGSVCAGAELDRGGGDALSEARRQRLAEQVEQKLELHRAARRVPVSEAESLRLQKKCNELLDSRTRGTAARARRLHERVHARKQTELAFSGLEKHVRLEEIPAAAEPHNFPLPPKDSLRMARARQGHAALLAQEKSGTNWWKHLRAANEFLGDADDDWTIWDEMDHARIARWERVLYEEDIRASS